MYAKASGTNKRGPEETRTPDLLHAMEALYQLSYRPKIAIGFIIATIHIKSIIFFLNVSRETI